VDFNTIVDDVEAAQAIAASDAETLRLLSSTTAPWELRALVLETAARRCASTAVLLLLQAQAAHLSDGERGCCGLFGAAHGTAQSAAFVAHRADGVDGALVVDGTATIVGSANAMYAVLRAVLGDVDVVVVVDATHESVTHTPIETHGLRTAETARLTCVATPARVVDGADAVQLAHRLRVDIASIAVGVSEAAFDVARTRALLPSATPRLALQQAVQFKIADMKVDLDGARLLTRQVAWRLANGEDVATLAALALINATETAIRTTELAMRVFGDEANNVDNIVERLARDAQALSTVAGNNDHLREQVAATMLDER
jgi:alkylation response protein AidB-like acyl-CoA dehydrogenase